MFKHIRKNIALLISPEISQEIKDAVRYGDDAENRANQRLAKTLLDMDPFEPALKRFHGVFGEEFEHPEEKLDERGQMLLKTLGYQLKSDISFKYLTEWILNTQGNNTLRKARTDYELFYGRACIVNIELFVKEIGRLAGLYEEDMAKRGNTDFDQNLTIE